MWAAAGNLVTQMAFGPGYLYFGIRRHKHVVGNSAWPTGTAYRL